MKVGSVFFLSNLHFLKLFHSFAKILILNAMKRVETILFSLLVILTYSCHSEQIVLPATLSISTSIQSRNSTSQTLTEGSRILVNTQGALTLNNEIFTYNGIVWEDEQGSHYFPPTEETRLTALYPVYETKHYSEENLYSEGKLEDILVAQETFSNIENLELRFKHLFSMFTFHLESSIIDQIKEIRLTTPTKISSISPQDGTYTTVNESHTSYINCNGSENYSFIIPPQEKCPLTLWLLLADDTLLNIELEPHTFISGYQYKCNLDSRNSTVGIRTAEDLIILSQLINNTYSGNQTLSNFGETTNGKMVFRLLNDITFTEEECNQFHPIGKYSKYPFTHIFDGNGYTISNLILPDKNTSDKQTGLFGNISEDGIVRNLNLSHTRTVETPSCKYIGVLSANNSGQIINCSVINSAINTIEYNYIGLISSKSSGTIINCYSQDNTINVTSRTQVGAIAGYASGHILNCYTNNNIFSTAGEGYRIGSISGTSASNKLLTVENCYIHHTQETKLWGAAIGLPYQIALHYFFYNKGKAFCDTPKNSNTSNTYLYNSNYCIDDTPISVLLNEWITTSGSINYPDFTFKRWKVCSDSSICFE